MKKTRGALTILICLGLLAAPTGAAARSSGDPLVKGFGKGGAELVHANISPGENPAAETQLFSATAPDGGIVIATEGGDASKLKVFRFTAAGRPQPGFGKGGTGTLRVDDKDVAVSRVPHTVPFLFTIDETFDVGVDTRTPVDGNDYQVPFRFTGKLNKLTFNLGPTQVTSDDRQVIQHNLAKARD